MKFMNINEKRDFIKEKSIKIKEGFIIVNYNEQIEAFTVVCKECGLSQLVSELQLENLSCSCECSFNKAREIYDNRITYEEIKKRIDEHKRIQELDSNKIKRREFKQNRKVPIDRFTYKLIRERRNSSNRNLNRSSSMFGPKLSLSVIPKDFDREVLHIKSKKQKKSKVKSNFKKPVKEFIVVDVLSYTMGYINGEAKNYVICKLLDRDGDCNKYYIEENDFKKRKFFKHLISKSKPRGYKIYLKFDINRDCNFEINTGYFGLDMESINFYDDCKELYVILSHPSIEPTKCKLSDYFMFPKKTTKQVIESTKCKVSRKDIDSDSYITEVYFDETFCNEYIKNALGINKFIFSI